MFYLSDGGSLSFYNILKYLDVPDDETSGTGIKRVPIHASMEGFVEPFEKPYLFIPAVRSIIDSNDLKRIACIDYLFVSFRTNKECAMEVQSSRW